MFQEHKNIELNEVVRMQGSVGEPSGEAGGETEEGAGEPSPGENGRNKRNASDRTTSRTDGDAAR